MESAAAVQTGGSEGSTGAPESGGGEAINANQVIDDLMSKAVSFPEGLPEDTEDPEGATQTVDGATGADVDALLSGEDPVEQTAEQAPVPKPAAPNKQAAPDPMARALDTLAQQAQQQQQLLAMHQQTVEALPQIIAQSQQQFLAQMMGMANQQAAQRKAQEAAAMAAPKPPGPEATVEDMLRYEVEKAKFDSGQQLSQHQQEMLQLRQRLDQFENGVTRERNAGSIRQAMSQVSQDPNYWWTQHPVGSELVLSTCNSLIQSGAAKGFSQDLVNHVSHQLVNFMEFYADQRQKLRTAKGSQGAAQAARTQQQSAAGKVPTLRSGESTPAAGGKTDNVEKMAQRWFKKRPLHVR